MEQANSTTPVKLLTPDEAANELGLSKSYLAKLRWNGNGPTYVRIAKRAIRYSREDLASWVNRCRQQSTNQN